MYFLGITWNPDDTLFKLGFLQIKYYNLLWIVAFVVGWFIMKRIFFNEKRDLRQLDALFIYTVLSTMLGARLGHVFFYDWAYYKNHLVEILLPALCFVLSSLRGSDCRRRQGIWKLEMGGLCAVLYHGHCLDCQLCCVSGG